jgi:hypothetical protein
MNPLVLRARLCLLGAAVLMLFGGMLFAVARWNGAETDRAFVEAAARAARLPPPAAAMPPRYWAPTATARPDPVTTIRIEATERLRTMPAAPPPPASGTKPPAAPR